MALFNGNVKYVGLVLTQSSENVTEKSAVSVILIGVAVLLFLVKIEGGVVIEHNLFYDMFLKFDWFFFQLF